MNLVDILKLKFPTIDFFNQVNIQDDGQGAYIARWDNELGDFPTPEILAQWEQELQPLHQFTINKEQNKYIKEQLEVIDAKSIRALRTNDVIRLEELEAEAINLRSQLLPEN